MQAARYAVGTDAGERGFEFLPIVGAGAAVGDGIGHAGRLHLLGKSIEISPGDRRLVGLGLVQRALGEEQHVGAVDLQRQGNPLAARLVQFCKIRRDDLFVAGGSDNGVKIDGRGNLRPGRNLGALELRAGRRIAGDDLGAQLVHHLGGEAGDGRVLPNAALLLEFLAERRDRSSIAACGPLRDCGQARFDRALRAGKGRQRERGSRSSEQTAPCCCDRHGKFLPVVKFFALFALFLACASRTRLKSCQAASVDAAGMPPRLARQKRGEGKRGLRIVADRGRHESERHLRQFPAAQQAGIDPVDERPCDRLP